MNRNLKILIFVAVIYHFSVSNAQDLESRIVGGRNATDNEIKYIVAVKNGRTNCGGGIIDDKFIITAAHCVRPDKNGHLQQQSRILAATNTKKKYNKQTTIVIDVVKAFLPAVYSEKGINDIAILELAESLELKKNKKRLQKLYLPKPNEFNVYPSYENVKFKFAGYGRSHVDVKVDSNGKIHYHTTSGGRLHVANATVIDEKACQKSRKRFKISDRHICISIIEDEFKKNPQGTCKGDSGSPAVINNKVIIGIDSVGSSLCDNNFRPTIFTRVSSYIPFIKNVLKGKTNGTVIYTKEKK